MDDEWVLGKEGLVYSYAQIAFHLAFRYINLTEENQVKPEGLIFPRNITWEEELDSEVKGLEFQSIIITAFFFEAYINDYSFRYLDKDIFERLDKLNTPSKLIVVTKLVWGSGLCKSSHNFEKLQKLFKFRNNLAHPKSSNKGDLFDPPSILQNSNLPQPFENITLIRDVLRLFHENYEDDVTEVLLKQMAAWMQVAVSDTNFYPTLNNAGL